MRKLAALPSVRKGEEREGAGLGSDTATFPSSGHIPECRGSIQKIQKQAVPLTYTLKQSV